MEEADDFYCLNHPLSVLLGVYVQDSSPPAVVPELTLVLGREKAESWVAA